MYLGDNFPIINSEDVDVHPIKKYTDTMDESLDSQKYVGQTDAKVVPQPLEHAAQQQSSAVHSAEDLEDTALKAENYTKESGLSERIARLEEGQKYMLQSIKDLIQCTKTQYDATKKQIELLIQYTKTQSEAMDKRTDLIIQQTKTQSESMDKRTELIIQQTKTQSEAMGKRTDLIIQQTKTQSEAMGKRTDLIIQQTKTQFEDMGKRTDLIIQQTKTYFETTNKRIDDLRHQIDKRFKTIYWILGILILLTSDGFAALINVLFGG